MTEVDAVRSATKDVINALFNKQNVDKAALASLRSAPTITSLRAETVWPVILPNIPNRLLGSKDEPSAGENAVYTAIRLFAIYQQAKDYLTYVSHTDEDINTLFGALATLRANSDNRDALDRRVQACLGSNNFKATVHSLTQLLSILKSSKTKTQLDFVDLAEDLYKFQANFEAAGQVKLTWGQQYYRYIQKPKTEGKQ